MSEICLPEGWVQAALGDVAIWSSGGTPSRANPKFYSGTIPWFKTGELGVRTLRQAEEHISEEAIASSSAKVFPRGSVALAMYGATIGKASILGIDAATNQACAVGLPDAVGAEFLYHFLISQTQAFTDAGKGGAQPNISQGIVKEWPICVPPLAEQTRIVAKLEELLSDLDAGVAELKAAQKKLAQYRQSLLKVAVEGQLTADWRARHTPAESGVQLLKRILTERRARWQARQLDKFAAQGKPPPKDWQAKYPEPVAPESTGLPELPQGWVWATVDQLAAIGTGVTPLRSKTAYFEQGSIPWVTSGALNKETVSQATELVTELALNECRLELYPAGALLVAMYGEGKTRGKCSELLISATINQAIAALVLEETALQCKQYLKNFLLNSYEKMRQQASGGVQPNLNLQIVRSIALPLPPVSEQVEIGHAIAEQFEVIDRQLESVVLALRQSTAQRKNILQAAFSGQLVPQDPADEPASALLARIRAERAARDAIQKPRSRKARDTA